MLSVTLFRRGFLGLFLIERDSICHIDPSSSESRAGAVRLEGQGGATVIAMITGVAVACQRTFAVRVIRAALKPCIAPRLGPNVSLAGEPRLVPKLQPAVARRGRLPARANSFSTEGVSRLRHGSCDTKR